MNRLLYIAVGIVIFADSVISQESLPFRVRIAGGISNCVSLEKAPIGPSFSVKLRKNLSPPFGVSLSLQTDRIRNMDYSHETGNLGLLALSAGFDPDSITSLSWYGRIGGGVAFGAGYNTKGAAHLTSGLALPVIGSMTLHFEGSAVFLFYGSLGVGAYVLLRFVASVTL